MSKVQVIMEKTKDQIEHSRLLDVHRWSNHPEVNGFCTDIWERYFYEKFEPSGKGNRPKKHPKYQLKVLLLDLYVAWKTDPDLLISLSFTKSSYKGSTRYNKLHISYLIVELSNHALDVGLIERHKGSEASGRVSRIWPTPKLLDYFNGIDFELYQLEYSSEQEVVCLSKAKDSDTQDLQLVDNEDGKKKIPFKYSEYDDLDAPSEISMWREVLHDYNRLLSNTFVDIGSLELPSVQTTYWDKKAKKERTRTVFIGQHNKYVKRIFYRNDWGLGGRLHGGWWQQVKSTYRKDILINDEITQEQDFKGLHVTLLYGLKGLQPPKDPYVTDLKSSFSSEENRALTKALVLNAINAKDMKSAFQAFRSEQKTGSAFKKIKNEELRVVIDAFVEANPEIEGDLFSDKGVELMAIDGRVTYDIIEHFTKKGIPVLSVHDSYITTEEHSSELYQRMRFAIMSEMAPYNPNQDHLDKLSSSLNLIDYANVRLGLLDFDAKIERELNSIAFVETWKSGMKWVDLQTKAEAEWDNRACNSYGQRYRKWKQCRHGRPALVPK
jgi:hypothetical protein